MERLPPWIAVVLVSMATVDGKALELVVCDSCVNIESPLGFCGELRNKYPVCLQRDMTLEQQDRLAESHFAAFHAASNSTNSATTICHQALREVACMFAFPACELAQERPLCSGACAAQVTNNCSTSFAALVKPVTDALCGTIDDSKCIPWTYSGPNRGAWVAGFTISVVFSFLSSVGINLQKRALKQNEVTAHETGTQPLSPFRLPLWTLGFCLIVAGSLLDFIAFGLAPQSLLAPLAALTLVWNMMLAPCFNKERLSRKDIWATLIIFLGATLAVVFANHNSPSYTLDDLKHLYRNSLTLLYFAIVFVLILLHYVVIKCVEHLHLASHRHRIINFGDPSVWSTVRLVAYAGLGGLMGGQSVLFAKSTIELVKSLFAGGDCFTHAETYCIIVAMGGCLIAQMHFLNGGLANYDALSVVPIYQAYWIISGVMGGAVYFQEIRSFSEFQACMFVVGILTTIGGVALLAQRSLLTPPPLLKKRKTLASRNLSSYWHNPQALAKSVNLAGGSADGAVGSSDDMKPRAVGRHASAITTTTEEGDEEGPAVSQGSSDDDGATGGAGEAAPTSNGIDDDNEDMNSMNRQAIENSLDMSPMGTFLMGFPSQRNLSIFLRRESSNRLASANLRPNHPRMAQDDIEIGTGTGSTSNRTVDGTGADVVATESADEKRKAKRRSITFAGFKSSKK
ncbi:hypothetical protein H310_06676 [Aphanomyces invadans]|uniref:FZ domain-containing protein n=1 Tax=Aphanomyces invadans TaxID=157072 RepID=A0A024U490_9STRA|nr:hypothetical protein H310_06676 [Aphanomyces invadans]ETW01045.1 hypothetical protein H310_06676 [Aphanomyces invadans]|eukprot:XP_008870043.1 hypothetical protein H310_06676 [Aphanomyces invadans]